MKTYLENIPYDDSSNVESSSNSKQHIKRKQKRLFVLSLPNYTFWNILILVFVTIDFYLTTLCFILLKPYTMDIVPFFITSDSIYIFNLALLLFHRFWKKLSTKLPEITKTSSLILVTDLISILPQVTLLLIYFRPDYTNVVLYCRLAICLRLHRLSFFNKVLEKFLHHRWVWCLVQSTVYFLVALHTTTVTWFLVTKKHTFCTEKESWKMREGNIHLLEAESLGKWYFLTTYLSLQTLLNVGFGDFSASTLCEMFWFIFTMLTGQFLGIFFISVACWLTINRKFHKMVYGQMVMYVDKYIENLTNPAKNYIKNYYKNLDENHHGIPLLNSLPLNIQMDVSFDINGGLLHRSLLLKHLPIYIQRKIALAMKTILLVPDQPIYYKGITKKYMVCIERGSLEVLYDDIDHISAIFFKEGAILGEVSLFLNVSSNVTVRAMKCTELRVLEKTDFLRVMLDYPEELRRIRNLVAYRIDRIVNDNTSEHFASQNLKTFKAKLPETGDSGIGNIEYYSMYKLSKNVIPKAEEGICRIVTGNRLLMKMWLFLVCVIQTVYCLWYPYHAVFERYIPYDLYVFGIMADVIYFLDVLLQCTTAIKFKDKIVTKFIEIIDIKLKHWSFYCDIFSLFSIEVWAYVIENPAERGRMYDLLKLNRLLRIWRVKYLLELFRNGNSYFVQTLKSVTYLSIFTYFASCLLYLNACLDLICHEDSWYHQKVIKDLQQNKDIEYGEFILPTSLYFAVMCVFHTGLGDVLPKTDRDIAIIILIILLSMILKTVCISQMVSSMFLKEFCSRTYELSFYLKMSLNHFQLPKQIKRRMKRFVSSARYLPEKHGSRFIEDTTSELLQDELQIAKIQNCLSNVSFLKMADTYFIAMLEKEAKIFFLPENESLYSWGDRTRQMYILQQGYCNLYNSDHLLEKSVGPGTQIGVIEMFSRGCKKHTVIATTDCVIISLEYRSFSNVLKLFPMEYNALEDLLKSQWFLRMLKKMEPDKNNEENVGVLYRKMRINSLIRTSWKKLWRTYRSKLGMFWFTGFLLLPFTIHPQCMFIKIWCTIRCLLIVTSGVALPLVVMLPPLLDFLYWLVLICQCSLYMDMYILLHVAYYDDRGQLETQPLYTAWRYITHSFVTDLLAALPLAHISSFVLPSHSNQHILVPHARHCKWNLVGLIQFHRVFKFLGYLKRNSWRLNICVEVVKIVVLLVLLVHILATLILSIICTYEFDSNKVDVNFYDPPNGSSYHGTVKCQNGFWLDDSVFGNITATSGLYLVGAFGAINFVTHTGLESFTAQSWLPMIGITLTTVIGFALFSFVYASIVTKMLQKVAVGIDYRRKVQLLELFLKKNSVPIGLQKKVFGHLKFIWQRTKSYNYSKMTRDFDFNPNLTEDVLLVQFASCLKQCAIFHHLDANSLRLIVKYIQIYHYQKGELVISYKDVIGDIFIVSSGEVELLNKNHYCLGTLGIGGTFGNIHQSAHRCNRVYVKARTNVELCVIATEKLLDIIKQYPHIFRQTTEILTQKLEYVESHNLSASDSQKDTKGSDFWDEIGSDDELPPKRKSSLDLLNPLVVLKPHHFIFKSTAFLTFVASCLNVIFIPYVFVTQDQHYICFLYLLFEPIFYVRIYMKLRQAYYNFYGNIIKSRRKIIQRYFNTTAQVLWDAMSNFPLSLVCFVREEWFFLYSCLRMLHLLRIYYILEYFKVHEEKFKLRIWLPIVKLSTIYVILIHLCSCFWLMMACPFGNCYSETWISQNKYMSDTPSHSKMLLSYYYVISTITTTGIGDILPQDIFEVIATFVIMLVGKLMIIVFIGTILWTIYHSNFNVRRFEYKAALLRTHLRNQDLSRYQMRRIWSYVQNLWKYEGGRNFPKLFRELPHVLTCDVMMCLYGHHLRQNVLFKNTDEALLRQICSKFQRQLFFHYDYIVKTGDVNTCMYFIQIGNVSVLTKPGTVSETEHVLLHANDMFGIPQGFDQGTPHHFTYRAASDFVEVLTLPFESWSFLLPHFPRDKTVIFARMQRECIKV